MDDNSLMPDDEYRVLLKQKAEMFRSQMTDFNLIKYFLIYGAPVTIDEEDILTVVVTPDNDGDLTQWERWYILNKGFKPAGIKVKITHTTGAAAI